MLFGRWDVTFLRYGWIQIADKSIHQGRFWGHFMPLSLQILGQYWVHFLVESKNTLKRSGLLGLNVWINIHEINPSLNRTLEILWNVIHIHQKVVTIHFMHVSEHTYTHTHTHNIYIFSRLFTHFNIFVSHFILYNCQVKWSQVSFINRARLQRQIAGQSASQIKH